MTAHFEINCTYTATSIPAESIPNSFIQISQPAQNKTVKKNFQKHLELHWQAKRFVYMRRVRKRERGNFERARDVTRCHQKRQSFIFFALWSHKFCWTLEPSNVAFQFSPSPLNRFGSQTRRFAGIFSANTKVMIGNSFYVFLMLFTKLWSEAVKVELLSWLV